MHLKGWLLPYPHPKVLGGDGSLIVKEGVSLMGLGGFTSLVKIKGISGWLSLKSLFYLHKEMMKMLLHWAVPGFCLQPFFVSSFSTIHIHNKERQKKVSQMRGWIWSMGPLPTFLGWHPTLSHLPFNKTTCNITENLFLLRSSIKNKVISKCFVFAKDYLGRVIHHSCADTTHVYFLSCTLRPDPENNMENLYQDHAQCLGSYPEPDVKNIKIQFFSCSTEKW